MRIYDITYNLAEDTVSVEVVPNKLTLKKDAEVYFFTKKVSSKDELKQTLAAMRRRGPWELSASIKAPNEEAALEIAESVFSVWLKKVVVPFMWHRLELTRQAFKYIREVEAEQTKGGNKDD